MRTGREAAVFGIAWGQTPVNPARFRGRHGRAIVSFAGPAVNLSLGMIGLLLAGLVLRAGGPEPAQFFLWIFGIWNVFLLLLNLRFFLALL